MPTFKVRAYRKTEFVEWADGEVDADTEDDAVAAVERMGEVGLAWKGADAPTSVTLSYEVSDGTEPVTLYHPKPTTH